jgi:hypothetical protein
MDAAESGGSLPVSQPERPAGGDGALGAGLALDGPGAAAEGPGAAPDGAQGVATPDAPVAGSSSARALVAGLSIERFRENIKTVAAFGDRLEGSPRFDAAAAWLDTTLAGLGYTVEHHSYTFQGGARVNTVSSHLDGRGGGGAADDNGSGVSLVLEVARSLAPHTVATDVSIRFAFWCNEETGMDGSRAYVRDRAARQGVEDPPGSGRFPEPRWLGMIQHDMMLYDHGLPPGPQQSPTADINIDFQLSSRLAGESKLLAQALAAGARIHAREYPPTVGNNMAGTDSVAFQDAAPSVSVREARRIEEIIRGSNPNHHKPTDQPESYSDLDYRLGFNALQTTLGTVADLTGARIGQP